MPLLNPLGTYFQANPFSFEVIYRVDSLRIIRNVFSKDISNASTLQQVRYTLNGVKYKINGIDFTAYVSTRRMALLWLEMLS